MRYAHGDDMNDDEDVASEPSPKRTKVVKHPGRNARVRGKSSGANFAFNPPPRKRADHQRPGASFRQSAKDEASSVTPDWALDPALLPKKPPGRK